MLEIFKVLQTKKINIVILVGIGIVSGILNLGVIYLINRMIQNIIVNKNVQNFEVLLYILGCLVFWYVSKRILSVSLIKLTQKSLWRIRLHVINEISKSNFLNFKSGKHKISTALTENVVEVSTALYLMIDFIISLVTSAMVLFYLAYLSLSLFVAAIAIIGLGILFYIIKNKKNIPNYMLSTELLDQFHRKLDDFFGGFKELKMDYRKNETVLNEFHQIGEKSIKVNTRAFTSNLDNEMINQITLYLLMATLGVFFGNFLRIETEIIVSFLLTLLFMQSSLVTIMTALPFFTRAKVALERIREIENMVASGREEENSSDLPYHKEHFKKLEIEQLHFEYPVSKETQRFNLEDINFEIEKGQIVFITGGNGSGKTTLINLLLALLNPSSGKIRVNGNPDLFGEHVKKYRTLFATVFNDFYLFEELYLSTPIDSTEVNFYLELFEISNKVTFENNRFSTKELSTGQRKRLALIAQILENKPIIVLDEWAADQDPYFRKKFYHEILPLLKGKEFTIIAITHDDRYFSFADQLFKMSEGRLIKISQNSDLILSVN